MTYNNALLAKRARNGKFFPNRKLFDLGCPCFYTRPTADGRKKGGQIRGI